MGALRPMPAFAGVPELMDPLMRALVRAVDAVAAIRQRFEQTERPDSGAARRQMHRTHGGWLSAVKFLVYSR